MRLTTALVLAVAALAAPDATSMRSTTALALAVAVLAAPDATSVAPGESIAAAIVAARATPSRTVTLLPGVHYLPETLALTAADSGLILRGAPGVTLDGGVPLPPFSARADGVWTAPLPKELAHSKGGLSALYVNGERRLRARAPNAVGGPPWAFPSLFGDAATLHARAPLEPCSKPAFGTCPAVDSTGFFADAREAGWPNASAGALDGALIAVAAGWLWDWARVKSFNASGNGAFAFAAPLRDAVGAYGSTRDSPSGGRFFLEDAHALLDAPGEFFVDTAAQAVLYIPLPGETPAGVTAVMPNLIKLAAISGTAAAPATDVLIEGVALQHFGEGGPDARLGYWAYSAAVEVGPYAANATLRNVSLSRGVADGVGVAANVDGLTLDRVAITDVGGKGVGPIGDLGDAETTVRGFLLANSTIAHVGYVFTGGACAASPVGAGARVLNNDLSDSTYAGVLMQGPGGASRATAPTLEVAYNRIYDYGQGIISDFGGVYLSSASDEIAKTNWLAADVHHNWISGARNYPGGYGANGVYTDHGTSGARFFSNIIEGLGGRGGSLHCGNGIEFFNNVIFNVSFDNFTSSGTNNGALSSCNGADVADPGFSANISTNIFVPGGTLNVWAPEDTTWSPPADTVAGDNSVYWAGGAHLHLRFPGGSLVQWRALSGADAHSVEADPLLRDPARGDFSLLPGSPAWARGWVAIDQSQIGVVAGAARVEGGARTTT
jgi:hypothetical protein